jgi:hypothetical protein
MARVAGDDQLPPGAACSDLSPRANAPVTPERSPWPSIVKLVGEDHCPGREASFDRARSCFLCGEMDLLDRELMFLSTIANVCPDWPRPTAVQLVCGKCGDRVDGGLLDQAA